MYQCPAFCGIKLQCSYHLEHLLRLHNFHSNAGCLHGIYLQAARLGLNVGSIGHVGSDVYGQYMDRIMHAEGIHSVLRIMPPEVQGTPLDETLLCFVLVDPNGK